ncbi:MAG: hypothetical protein QM532_01600 [Cyanobium sp. MAG06]|nr:hypothetical protein [Cyanobium sp. MAG06]
MILAFVFNVKGNLFVRLLNKYDYDIYNINKTQKVILYLCSIIFFTIFILSAYFKLYPQVVSAYYYNKYNSLHASNKSSEDAVSYLLKAISYNSKTEMKYHLELAHIYENNIAKNMDNSIIALEKIYNNMLSYSNKKDYIYTRIAKLYTYRDNIENYKHIYNIYNIDNKNKDVLSILINYGLVNKYYKILDISIVRDSYRQGFIKVNTIIDIAEQLTKDMEYSKSNKYYELAINLKYNKEKNIDTSLLIAIFNNLIYTGQYSKATLLYQMYIVDKSSQLTNIKDHEVELKVIRNKIGIYI